jgi:(4S)-4-hydroxy-5-phosphonooxypentane-2,3-dione isomerase
MGHDTASQPSTFVVIVNIAVEYDHREDFRAAVLKQAENSIARSPGCHRFDVCQGTKDKAEFALYEFYESADHFAGHLQTEHFRSFDQLTKGWIKSKHVSTFALIAPD